MKEQLVIRRNVEREIKKQTTTTLTTFTHTKHMDI